MSLKSFVTGHATALLLSDRAERAGRAIERLRARSGRKHPRLTLFYRVDDPYSYLLVQLLPALLDAYDVELDCVVVGAPGGVVEDRVARYAAEDAERLAQFHDLAFPFGAELPTTARTIAANCVMLRPRPIREQLDVAREMGAALFRADDDEISRLAKRAGALPSGTVTVALAANAEALARRGHYLSGTLTDGTQWYWGIDRLWHLQERLHADGATQVASILPRTSDKTVPVPRGAAWREGKLDLEFYYSFRSPYSYLAIGRVFDLGDRYPVRVHFKPVLPMVRRGLPVPLAKKLYIVRDAAREARRLNIPFGNVCDPLETVERPLALVAYAEEQDRLRPLLESIGRGVWAEGADLRSDAVLERLVERAGCSWSDARRRLTQNDWRARCEENQRCLTELGLWGVPSFRLGDEALWGQDRIEHIERYIRRATSERGSVADTAPP